MNDEVSTDLYKLVNEGDLGDKYYCVTVNKLIMLVLCSRLVSESHFFVALPLPDDEYELTVHAATRFWLDAEIRRLNALLEEEEE